ncbi:MAG: PQQ-dependent sugar dehydrogenase [Gammaproteobacteria bacterium]
MWQRKVLVAAISAFVAASAAAQQSVPMRNGIPVAPKGIVVAPLGAGPFTYHTAEGQDIRVVIVARGLKHPWSIAFPSANDMLVTERTTGQLRVIRGGKLDPQPVAGVPMIRVQGLGGFGDVVLHPQFATNHLVYLSYNKAAAENRAALAIARGTWDGHALNKVSEIFTTADTGSLSRLAFGRDGKLYASTAGGQDDGPQNPMSLAGKVLRLNDDGSVPKDNPFAGKPDHKPEIYTLGHRSPLALVVHPGTGQLWENENGPNGGDEINVLKPGANYGWPLVSLGRTYPGPWQSKGFSKEGFEDPIVYWTPAIATSGMAFYTGSKLPKWKGDVFVGGLRQGEIPGTGHLERILFNENMEELRREQLLTDLRQRIRDVRMGPDELLYLLTDEEDGAVLRIEPAN